MTREEKLRRADELEAEAKRLREEAKRRCSATGWSFGWSLHYGMESVWMDRLSRNMVSQRKIISINDAGVKVRPGAEGHLDGIAHDDKGRIKVVGYVNAEDLKARFPVDLAQYSGNLVRTIIDELAG